MMFGKVQFKANCNQIWCLYNNEMVIGITICVGRENKNKNLDSLELNLM